MSLHRHLLVFVFAFSLSSAVVIVNRRLAYHLNVTYAPNSTSIVLINNQMPGPTIEAELNDILIIHVSNSLPASERLAIHFHGMLVRQTPQMDGVPFVTQMPIESGYSFTYVIRAHPAGTYFYHSHAGLQSVTAFGALIVHDRRNAWNVSEVPTGPLLFSDLWFQPDRITQEHNLLASPFVWQGEPTYLLINGKRDFVLTLDYGKKYLLRLIGSTTLSTIVFGIDEHPMTVVEVDGTLIVPKPNVHSIELSSGQRYAVIIETNHPTKSIFLMQTAIRWRTLVNDSTCNGILRYNTYTSPLPANFSSLPPPPLAEIDELRSYSFTDPYKTLLAIDQMPRLPADQEIFLYNYQSRTADGKGMRWYTNNATLDKMRLVNLTQPLIYDAFNGIEQNLPADATYAVQQNQIVDIVLQNTVATNGVCETHPFHLHGHKFWVHSQGTGSYSDASSKPSPAENPVFRDSLTLYATSYEHTKPNRSELNYKKPCGWLKLRFVANNPGLWLLHCHIGSHLFMGMSILLKEDIEHLSMSFLSQH